MKFPPKEAKLSRRRKGSSFLPKTSLQELPMLIPPRQRGETLTEAVGDRIRWYPNGVNGLGGGLKNDMAVVAKKDRQMSLGIAQMIRECGWAEGE